MTSLYLSAALLRAILMNHFAFAEVTKTAKNVEATLKGKVDDLEIKNEKLESELRKQVSESLRLSRFASLMSFIFIAPTIFSQGPRMSKPAD
jgi:hypothetical protein